MARHRSILGDLHGGLAWIAAIGSVVLAIFLFVDFELFQEDVRRSYGHVGVLHEIVDHVLFPIVILLAPLALAIRWLIERSLAPLERAAERIHQATERERGFRVELNGLPSEAHPFATAVNALLARLDDAAWRQEGFAADVAHELKTPLAIAMLELERVSDPAATRVIADLAAMNRLVEQLLILAQLDAYSAAPQPLTPLKLEQPALDAIKLVAVDAARRRVALEFRDEGSVAVLGRREAIASAFRNLLENAIRVTPPGGEVTVVVGPGPLARVRDGGPGIEASQLALLVDRFRRGEHASAGGAGLGLSIVARIMKVHNGTLLTHPQEPSIELRFEPAET